MKYITALIILFILFFNTAYAAETENIQNAYRLISNWQAKEALQLLEKQFEDSDSLEILSPSAHAVFAWVYFWNGDYQNANIHIQYLQSKDNIPELLEPVTHTLTITSDYQEEKSDHFIFRFKPGKNKVLIPFAIEVLEKSYSAFRLSFGYEPIDPIRVEFYESIEELARITPLTLKEILTTGTIALCQFHKIVLVSPKIFPRGYHWQSTLAHELAHFFIGKKTMNRVPVWLQEGLAKHEEERWLTQKGNPVNTAQNFLLIRKYKENALVPFEKMHPSMAKLSSQDESSLAFAQVQDMVYLFGKKNNFAIAEMLDHVSKLRDEHAVEQYVDQLLANMKLAWTQDLQKRSQTTNIRNIQSANLEFSTDGDHKKDTISLEGVESENKSAIVLAQMLQSKKRFKAALVILQKQYDQRKEESPILSHELAVSYIDLGNRQRAEQILQESLKFFPEFLPSIELLSRLIIEQKKYDNAEQLLRKMISLNPFDPSIYKGLIEIHQSRGDIEKVNELQNMLPLLE